MRLTASDYHVLFRRRARKGIIALAFATLSWAQAGAAAASPPPADEASVARGAQTFQQYCTECHGRDGRAQVDVISDATDCNTSTRLGSRKSRRASALSARLPNAIAAWLTEFRSARTRT